MTQLLEYLWFDSHKSHIFWTELVYKIKLLPINWKQRSVGFNLGLYQFFFLPKMYTHTHTHTNMWLIATLHRHNYLYTVQTVFYPHTLNLPITENFCHFFNDEKQFIVFVKFGLWSHRKYLHKPCLNFTCHYTNVCLQTIYTIKCAHTYTRGWYLSYFLQDCISQIKYTEKNSNIWYIIII